MITVTCLINVHKVYLSITYSVCVDPSTLKPLIRDELLSRLTQQDSGLNRSQQRISAAMKASPIPDCISMPIASILGEAFIPVCSAPVRPFVE